MSLQYRKAKTTLNFDPEKPVVYKAQQVTYPMVPFDELVEECAEACNVGKAQTKAVIEALNSRLVHYMKLGHGVKMGSFGSFKPVFLSKMAETMEDANANTVKQKKIQFFPGKAFREMLNNLSVISASEILDDEEI